MPGQPGGFIGTLPAQQISASLFPTLRVLTGRMVFGAKKQCGAKKICVIGTITAAKKLYDLVVGHAP
ncbi:MAG: hypothetical protein ABFC92_09615, partial [Rectinema sp.]